MSAEPSPSLPSIFALIIGIFLLLEGTWGLFNPLAFGVLTTNPLHAGIQIVLGVFGMMLGLHGTPRAYLVCLGGLLMLVGLLRFVPTADQWIVQAFNVNAPAAALNLALGAMALAFGLPSTRQAKPSLYAMR